MTETAQKASDKPEEVQYETQIKAAIEEIRKESAELKDETHPKFKGLLEVINAAKLRELANVEIRYELAINHAKETLKFTEQQIELDYNSGQDDIKEKVFSDLRKKKKDVKEVMDREAQKGQVSNEENTLFNDLKIPNKKKDKKSFRGTYNFKLPEEEAKQDLALIESLSEELDEGKK